MELIDNVSKEERDSQRLLRQSLDVEDWRTLGFSATPDVDILIGLPMPCDDCLPRRLAKAALLGSSLYVGRVQSLEQARELILEQNPRDHQK